MQGSLGEQLHGVRHPHKKKIWEKETINSTFGAAVTFTRWQDDRKCGEYNH